MKYTLIFLSIIFMSTSIVAQDERTKAMESDISYQIEAKDVSSIDGIVAALYDVISGPAGAPRNWARMKALFKPDARLNATGKSRKGENYWVSMTVEDYIERNSAHFEKQGFFESEIHRKTDSFGQITQIFTTYEARFEAAGEVKMRGINSVQLTYDGTRYWIVNVLWTAETPEQLIPPTYLKQD